MPVTTERRSNVVTIRFSGEVTVEDLIESARDLDAIEQTTPGLPRLADATGVPGTRIIFTELVLLTAERELAPRSYPCRFAILVDSDLGFGVAGMFEALLDHPQVEVEVFRDRQAALAWLGVEDTEKPVT
jgi:hypothetical protein